MIQKGLLFLALAVAAGMNSFCIAQQTPETSSHHAVLKKSVGTWYAEARMWMPGADSPTISDGLETVSSECGGTWIRTAYAGKFAGQKFQGMGMTTYDPVTKKYTGTWGDSLTPGPARMVGTYDKQTKTMTYMVTGFDPQAGKVVTNKQTEHHLDENHREMKIYRDDKVVLHIQYTRTTGSVLKQQMMEKIKQLEAEAKKVDVQGLKDGIKNKFDKLKGKLNLDSIRKKLKK